MSASAPTRLVVDATIAVKWSLDDEDNRVAALAILDDFSDDRVTLIAPAHLQYEVSNAIRTAVHRQRLTSHEGLAAIERFLTLPIDLFAGDSLILAGYAMSLRYDCALYDGLYLALAEHSESSLVCRPAAAQHPW